jgi:hypothetical protein
VRFPVPTAAHIDPALRPQFLRFRDFLRTDAPEGAILVLLRCWVLPCGISSSMRNIYRSGIAQVFRKY